MSKIVFIVGLLATLQQATSHRGALNFTEGDKANANFDQQQREPAQSICPKGVAVPDDWPLMHEVALLGSGSFGTVYLCKIVDSGSSHWIPSVGTEVAVKTVGNMGHREFALAQWLARNGLEMDTGFPIIYGVGPNAIAMAKMDGDMMNWAIDRALEQLPDEDAVDEPVQHREITTPDEVKFLLANSCENLKMVHKTEILHRDIKPDNIGIANNGEIVRFLDLGTACSSAIEGALCEGVGWDSCVGTRPFFAPELWWCSCRRDFAKQFWDCAGAGGASEQTDIFAFGQAAVRFIQVAVWGDAPDMRGWPPTTANVEGMLKDLERWPGVEWRQLLSPLPEERWLPDDCRTFFANLDVSERLPVMQDWDEGNEPEEGTFPARLSPFLLEAISQGLSEERAWEIQREAKKKAEQLWRDAEQMAVNRKEQMRLELERRLEGTNGDGVFVLGRGKPVGITKMADEEGFEVIEEGDEDASD